MDSFGLLLDNVISDLNRKYGFEFEAAEFKPELVFSYGDGEVPTEIGKRDGDSQGSSHTQKFWDNSKKVWLPKDIFNATRSSTEVSLKLSMDDKTLLLDMLEGIKGELNVMPFVEAVSGIFEKTFKNNDIYETNKKKKDSHEAQIQKLNDERKKEDKPNKQESIDKEIAELKKSLAKVEMDLAKSREVLKESQPEIKETLKKFVSENSADIESRSKVIKEADTAFGSDIAQILKKVILRGKTPAKIKEIIKDSVKDKAVEDYEPKLDPNQKKFDKKDIKYILKTIQNYHKEGVRGIVKRLKGKFPDNLLEDVKDASEKFGDIEGVIDWLKDYEDKNAELKKWQGIVPNAQPGRAMPNIIPIFKPVTDFISKVKNTLDIEGYDNTFLAYTEKLFNAIKSYSRSNKRIPEFEWAVLDVLGGNDSARRQSLANAWRDAKVPAISKIMTEVALKLSDEFDTDKYEFSEKDLKGNPDKIYKKLKDMENIPGFVKDVLELRNKPVKFEGLLTLDEDGKILEDKTKLNPEDKEFITQVKTLLKEDTKEQNKEIRDEGMSPKEIKDRSKKYKDDVKFETKEELLNSINDMDKEELANLEKQFSNKKKQISDLRKQFRNIKKLDESSLSEHLKELKKTLGETADPKLLAKIQKLEEQVKSVKTMPDAKKEEVRNDIEKLNSEIDNQMDNKEAIQELLSRFKDLDSWVKDIGKKVDDRKEKEKSDQRKPPTDQERKDYTKKFHDAMVIHYVTKFPEIMYSKVPDEASLKKMNKLQKELKELEDKKDKSKKDQDSISDLKKQISTLEKTTKKIPKSEDEAVREIKKLRERLESLDGNKWRISPEDYKEYISKTKDLDEEQKKILEKAGVDFKNLQQKNIDEIHNKVKEEKDDQDTKKSSIIKSYTNSIFYKLDKLAHFAGDDFVKAELLDISERLKDLV